MRKFVAGLLGVMMAVSSLAVGAAGIETSKDWPDGWSFPYLGAGKGTWDASVGVFFWKDTFKTRNLQLRTDVDLAPGFRWHGIMRSNREFDTLSGFKPHFDENYVEGYGFYHNQNGTMSTSLRVGNVRYLHFPYPDAIAVFDQVPGISDLSGGAKTGYSGELLTLDYAHKSGLGAHFTGINWDFGRDGGAGAIENYLYYRSDFGRLHFESRYGKLALRPEPLGRSETGYNLYGGTKIGALNAGVLYEKLHNQSAYTGIMVSFPLNSVTKAMGEVAFDYDRTPQGFAMQVPVAKGAFGGIVKKAPAKGVLVGEILSERLRTYWQNGQARNYYEHRISEWGETGDGLVVVMKEEPWYLQAEALVSPHNFGNLKTWEKDRQGPAQLSQ
ncbi:MAG: hypothetical protein LLG02_09080, partial [Pelosinus sp.]|nr:hypothetical protein [Pelosinus sp.]